MVLERERDIIKLFITESLGAFCKSNLAYRSQITIEGLVGVTIDQDNVILVTIKESIKPSEATGDGCINVNTENFSPETSENSSFQVSMETRSEHPSSSEKIVPKVIIPYQNPETVPVKLENASHFEERTQSVVDQHDYCLDLTLHGRNQVTLIEPNNIEDNISLTSVGCLHRRRESEDGVLDSCHPDLKDEHSYDLPDTRPKQFLLPFYVKPHRTNLKKRKIQLLSSGDSQERNIDGDQSALSGHRSEEVKVKMEQTSQEFEARMVPMDGLSSDPTYQDHKEGLACNLSSAGKSILSSNLSTTLSSARWHGSGQLPWADFQNMLIKSWRRNHHEEMLLKPLAHALIETWTNLTDTTSHKRIGECVQAILLYEGRYVPVRDIQRLRLSSMTSQEIRSTMEFLNSTREGRVGCYREIRGGIGVFYKCPPHLVDMEFLESFGLTLAIYKARYSSRMVSNATNRHSAVYWYRIETCSPYLTTTEVL